MPENLSLLVDEQNGDLAFAGDLKVATKIIFIDVERDDPGPGIRIGFVAAHGGVVPPAEDEVFAAGDGHAIPAEVEVGVLEGLSKRHPGIDLRPLFGLKGDEEEIELSGKIAREVEFCFIETVGGHRREDGRLRGGAILSSMGDGQKKNAERKAR